MAFHVTYWDFIGWKDTFAKTEHDQRQRAYANTVWHKNSVYTPQFVINAKEYRRWFSFQGFPSFEEVYGGNLGVERKRDEVTLSFYTKEIVNKQVMLNIAVLGFDYVIKIKAGENEDRVLKQDFVVLGHFKDVAVVKAHKLHHTVKLPLSKILQKDEHTKALVVWLTDEKSQIIQAVGGYLNDSN